MNCRRLDGTLSRRRIQREVSAFYTYLTTISIPTLLTFIGLFAVATLLFTYIIPPDLIARSFQGFDIDRLAWRENLQEVQVEHTRFLRAQGVEDNQTGVIQQTLWHGVPIFGFGLVFSAVGIACFYLKYARQGVEQLVTGIRLRRKMYAKSDVFRMQQAALPPSPDRSTSLWVTQR